MAPDAEQRGDDAVRVIMNYRAGNVTLEEVIHLDKHLPPSDDLPEGGHEGAVSGFWFELRDRSGETIYRQIESNPLVHTRSDVIEATEDGASGLRRQAAVADEMTFSCLFPRPQGEGAHLVIFSSPLDAVAQGISAPAEPRWRLDLPTEQPD